MLQPPRCVSRASFIMKTGRTVRHGICVGEIADSYALYLVSNAGEKYAWVAGSLHAECQHLTREACWAIRYCPRMTYYSALG